MKTSRPLLCCLMALALILTSAAPVSAAHSFTDVPAGKWFTPYVEYVHENGLMNGTSSTSFSPNANMSRAMVVTVLHRLEGSPASGARLPFADVPAGKYYTDAVRWSYENGIVNGTSDTAFSPNADITRQQIVTIFYRYAQSRGLDTSARANLSSYSDRSAISNFASEAFGWAVSTGIINGTTDTTLAPRGSATRAQCAAILQRFIAWMNGDPAMPSGAVLVSNPQNFDSCNSYTSGVGIQEITYWSNYTVYYKNEPNPKDYAVIYRLANMDQSTAQKYVDMLQENGFTLVGQYSLKKLYSWGLTCDYYPIGRTHGLMYKNSIDCHLSLWHSSDGWFLYVSPDLLMCDLGLRMDGSIADRRPWGDSADSGLLRLSDGRYQTADGRLTTSLGYADVIQDGQHSSKSVSMVLTDGGTLRLNVRSGSDTLIRFDYENGTLHKNSTLRRQELEDDDNPTLRILMGEKMREMENTSKYLRQCTVRIMEQTDQVIVYYIYASLDGSPEEIEALCAMRVDDIETPEDREEDDDNNSSTPDHDNDYGSALPCTACRGSGRCSKCGGDGMLYSSASGEEDRNCYKCNASGRCQTCGGTGNRYN